MSKDKKTEKIELFDILKEVFTDKKDIIKKDNENTLSETIGNCRAREILKDEYNIVSLIKSDLSRIMKDLKQIGLNNNKIVIVYEETESSKDNNLKKLIRKFKKSDRNVSIFKSYFEDIGFKYVGPIEEKNVDKIKKELNKAKNCKKPYFIHVINNKKSKKYENLDEDFSIEKVVSLGEEYKRLAIVTNASNKTIFKSFEEKFPERIFFSKFFDESEFNSIIGMAKKGIIPFVYLDTGSMIKGYESIVYNSVKEDLSIVFCIRNYDREKDFIDYSYLNTIPNLTIMSPKNNEEFEKMMDFAVKLGKPVVIKVSGKECDTDICRKIKLGKAEMLQEGNQVSIVALDGMVQKALDIAKELKKEKISVEVINARFVKPIDRDMINTSIEKTGLLVTLENNMLSGGFGRAINSLLESEVKILNIGLNDNQFDEIQDNPELIDDIFDTQNIKNRIINLLNMEIDSHEEKIADLRNYELETEDEINDNDKKKVGNL